MSKYLIIGITLLIGLTVQAESAHALYSPRLSRRVSVIKEHVQGSQAQNGHQTVLEEIEYFKAYDKAKREAGLETGIAGDARIAQDLIFDTTINFLALFPLDSIMMIFNFNAVNGEWLSNCLRDEIWSLETLRDLVGSEMVKAYLVRDPYHGELLMVDYLYLTVQLDLLREYGSHPTDIIQNGITSNEYFFSEKGSINYYSNVGIFDSSDATSCPEGQFEEAFDQVLRSFETLKVLGSGGGVEWGDIWKMAQANARIRAKQWIRENQISVTVGGEEGGRPESLVKGGGWDKFTGSVKTQLRIAEDMVGPVTPLFEFSKWVGRKTAEGLGITDECVIYYSEGDLFKNCDGKQEKDYVTCQDDVEAAIKADIRCDRFRTIGASGSVTNTLNKQLALHEENTKTKQEVETAFVYNLTIDSVAEQSIYFVDDVLWDMNNHIQRGYEGLTNEAGEGIPSLTDEVEWLANRQCSN